MKDYRLIPVWVAILAGCVALFGNYYNGRKSLEIEKKQFESNLILKFLAPNDSAQSIKNIRFLIKAGFISKDNDKIINLIRDTIYHIELPKQDTVVLRAKNGYEVQMNNLLLFSGQVLDQNKKPLSDVDIQVFDEIFVKKNREKAYSLAKSDKNGLFKVALPKQDQVKIIIKKNGFRVISKIYITSMLKNLHEIPLETL